MLDDTPGSERRLFFREAIGKLLRPVVDYVEARLPQPAHRVFLRPPGAIDEARFLDTCQRCGACVDVCPARAIFPLGSGEGAAAGTPAIDADKAACVVCDGLQCTHVCPSGALLPLSDPIQIRMGLAEVYGSLCVRSHGERCTICVDRCPIGASAILFADDGPPRVLEAGCVGCGVCQLYCPTAPKAIVVKPI